MNDQIAQSLGFSDAKEFSQMVSDVDMSTDEKISAFKKWQDEDGTKEGILMLMDSD